MSGGASPRQVPYGWYGDDFTGATDTLAAISRRGRRAFLFLSVPTARQLAEAGPLDAIGIAGTTRAMAPVEMLQALPEAGRFFREQGVRLLHYKCCSTFDSAPEVGNLAAAIAALRPFVAAPVVPIVGGQPSLGRYCAFSNLFALGGERVHRIDRHPTMSRHPATPMNEADLVRHFETLGLPGVAALHFPAIDGGMLEAEWRWLAAQSPPAILLDVLDDSHVAGIGALLRRESARGSMLAVGASSVAEAWFATAPMSETTNDTMGAGPVFAFAGSLSPATRRQVAAARSYRVLRIEPGDVIAGTAQRDAVMAAAVAALADGRNVLVSTAPPNGTAPQAVVPDLARASAALVDAVVRRSGVRRLAIAGGDTSSLVTAGLGFWGLAYHGLAARGVTVCRARSEDPARDGMLLMLKGGQMGDDAVFETFAGAAGPPDIRPAVALATSPARYMDTREETTS